MNLWELTSDFKNIENMLENYDGDNEEERQALIDTLESIDLCIEDKADNIVKLIRNLENDSLILKSTIQDMSERKKRVERRIDSLKNYLKSAMISLEKKKLSTPLWDISIGKATKSVEITKDLIELPMEFVNTDIKPNKKAIAEYLRKNDIEECDFAKFSKQKDSLRIKVK